MKTHTQDGHWQIKKFPAIGARLIGRIFKGGQSFTDLPPDQPCPPPTPIPTREKQKPGKKAAQPANQGEGALFYRRYFIDFSTSQTAESVMQKVQANPNAFSPQALAVYQKTKGTVGDLKIGDEFFIILTGPWNAPVRVLEVSPRSFSFMTLQDHMEAGEIRFSIEEIGPGLRFQIQSWARSRDSWVDLAYDKLKVAQWIQTEMWTSFLENIVKCSGARLTKNVTIETQRLAKNAPPM